MCWDEKKRIRYFAALVQKEWVRVRERKNEKTKTVFCQDERSRSMVSVLILFLIYITLKEIVANWYADHIAIITTVSAYELGLYIALGVVLVVGVACFILNDRCIGPDILETISKICYWLFGAGCVTGVVLGFVYEGWHWIFTLLLILYGYVCAYKEKQGTLFK